jgi:hypothetical protein
MPQVKIFLIFRLAGGPGGTAVKLRGCHCLVPPVETGGKAREARQGGIEPRQPPPCLSSVRLPPYSIGGTRHHPLCPVFLNGSAKNSLAASPCDNLVVLSKRGRRSLRRPLLRLFLPGTLPVTLWVLFARTSPSRFLQEPSTSFRLHRCRKPRKDPCREPGRYR